MVDAAVIAKQCDASMLVLAADNSSRKFVKNVVARLKAANPNFLGVVSYKEAITVIFGIDSMFQYLEIQPDIRGFSTDKNNHKKRVK